MPKGTQAPGKVCPIPSVPMMGLTYSTWAMAEADRANVKKKVLIRFFIEYGIKKNVIQSEAKNLGNINVDVLEILRYALDDIKE